MELTQIDIENNLLFLNRVDLKGHEAEAMTDLKIKLRLMHEKMINPPPDKGEGKDESEG